MDLYKDPSAMSPLMPEDKARELNELANEVIKESARLSSSMHSLTRRAIAEFLRPMNSYYSNLIEGHDTHPIDIDKAMKEDYSSDKKKRSLQLEARAHIETHKKLREKLSEENLHPFDVDFIKWLHKEFYTHLPDDLKVSISKEGKELIVTPGEFRICEVEVGNHIAPASDSLDSFIHRFEDVYKGVFKYDNPWTRIIAIAASHHRMAWIHPFLDGNGRVIRLLTDALFIHQDLDASGLWSMSRGLARNREKYRVMLANADRLRSNNYDGKGNLSNKCLEEFCLFFLRIAVDQLRYMSQVLDIDNMLNRIHKFVDFMVTKDKLRDEARYVLEAVFLKGEIPKKDVERLTGKSDKTAKAIAESLMQLELLTTDTSNRFSPYKVSYPIKFSSILFAGLYPQDKEIGMMEVIS
ncbi:Fic family protein [Pontibacter sp. JH31]|uniref:Fic family protein n=1 Tax=Pontibacter aquaedesilientis TaxID=2766980 RepID=A0ABR7XL95_9BACT|nr:Fic family protein [Pontibacter aquaedesilientis]MBD1399050.1 Fic family protein [Pontibacter aquaedesilientis]